MPDAHDTQRPALRVAVLASAIEVRDDNGLLVRIPARVVGRRLDHRRVLRQLFAGIRPRSVSVELDPALADPILAKAASAACLDATAPSSCSLTQETLPL